MWAVNYGECPSMITRRIFNSFVRPIMECKLGIQHTIKMERDKLGKIWLYT